MTLATILFCAGCGAALVGLWCDWRAHKNRQQSIDAINRFYAQLMRNTAKPEITPDQLADHLVATIEERGHARIHSER